MTSRSRDLNYKSYLGWLKYFLVLVTVLSILGLPAWAQSPSPDPGSTPTVLQLQKELEEIERRLKDAPARSTTGSAGINAIAPATDSLRRLDVSLRRLISLQETQKRLRAELRAVEALLSEVASQGRSEKESYSVEEFDQLHAELDTIMEKSQSAELATAAAKTTESLESDELQKLQATRRRLLDDQIQSPDDLELKRDLENIDVAIEAAQKDVELARAEIESSSLESALLAKREELLRLKLAAVQQGFRFSEDTLQSQIEQLEKSRQELNQRISDLKEAEALSRARLEALLSDEIDDSLQKEEIETRREWVDTHVRKARLLEERLEFNIIRRDLWERRYFAHSEQITASYDEWVESARGLLIRLQNNREILNTELSQIRNELSQLMSDGDDPESQSPQPESDADERLWREVQIQALVSRQRALEEALAAELDTERLARRLLSELSERQEKAPFSERAGQAWAAMVGFWNIELYTLGDSAVTVGKLSVAIFVLIVGLAVTGKFTRLLSAKFLARLPIQENIRINLERSLRYLFILLVFLFALHVVNIPLTIFTFLGGTLAIAIGFGAQNILNNFISGLILMVERPVRTGDLIQVDDTIGYVEEIGARSTRIRVPTGIHVILPNSSLLENKVVNWTLHDQKLRVKVSVGVAYGSPTRKVVELITKAVNDQEAVHRSPAPVVTFEDFGDSSLDFSVHFWITSPSPLDRDRVSTDVRLTLDDLFREHGISIPFPQRDLNFNSAVPVRIVQDK